MTVESGQETQQETQQESPPNPPQETTPVVTTQTPANPPVSSDNSSDRLIAEIQSIPEKIANVLAERNPKPVEKTSAANATTETASPNDVKESWDTRFARFWFGK